MKVNLATKDYVDNQRGKIDFLFIKSKDELDGLLEKYDGKCVIAIPSQPVVLNGITISEWTWIFFPLVTTGDTIAIAITPSGDRFYVLGHTTNFGWRVKQIY